MILRERWQCWCWAIVSVISMVIEVGGHSCLVEDLDQEILKNSTFWNCSMEH